MTGLQDFQVKSVAPDDAPTERENDTQPLAWWTLHFAGVSTARETLLSCPH